MAWLRFRLPGVALAPDEVMRRLGRSGGAHDRLRRADLQDGAWTPGAELGPGPIPAGSALCASVRPVRAFRPPPAGRIRLLVPRLPWPEGQMNGWRIARRQRREDVDEIEAEPLAGESPSVDELLVGLAALRSPAFGDVRRGGVLLEGGLRARAVSAAEPVSRAEPDGAERVSSARDRWWPDEPLAPAPGATLRVSAATLRALEKGHPWVLADRQLGDLGAFPSGHRVHLRGPGGADGGEALVDGEGALAARRWAPAGAAPTSVDERVRLAVARRSGYLRAHADAPDETDERGDETGTEAYRLIHGEADGLPGIAVDRLGDVLRLVVQGRAGLGLRDEVARILAAGLPGLPPGLVQLEVVQVRAPSAARFRGVTAPPGWEPPASWRVREAGLSFRLDAGLDAPDRPRPGVGLFLDQRENRAWARAHARGGCFANLFAHTGSFSAALLAGGAREVWSVDLSAAYLSVLEANLADNGLAGAAHHVVRGDARRFLATGGEAATFDGIVIDPPTAAAAGRSYWSVRSDLEPLLRQALARTKAGGWILVTRNERQAREPLAALVRRAAEASRLRDFAIEPAPPSADFPRLAGFPEGDAFEGICLRTAP